MSAIRQLIQDIDNLKPIPAIVNRIMNIIESPHGSMKEVADIIILDPMITANLLKICNSAYFGFSRKIESVKEAITMIGLDEVINLVLLKSGIESFSKNQDGYGLNEGDLWKQAVISALIAEDLAAKKGVKHKQVIFTAALLKDIGKVILDRFVKDSFAKIQALVNKRGYSFMEAEKRIIGIDHAELGGIVAKMWQFSPNIVKIIINHHLSNKELHNDLDISLVYLADNVCMMMGIGVGVDGLSYRFYDNVLKSLNFSDKDLQEIIAGFGEKLEKVEGLLNAVEG